jgi:hypothetical protein
VSRQNRPKEDLEGISDSEVWLAIRSLDPDLRRKPSQVTGYIALLLILVAIFAIWYSLYLRGL